MQPPAAATATPVAKATVSPSSTPVPAVGGRPEQPTATVNGPNSPIVAQRTATPRPTITVEIGEPHPQPTQPPASQNQAQSPVFYAQDGLTLEFYWPLDDRSNLSADETEILVYNESEKSFEFAPPAISFTEGGDSRAQISGAWEKFPSRYSWERIEYISFPPSPYQGEPLIVHPGEKARFHWHLAQVADKDTDQSVALDITVSTGAGTQIIARTLERGSEQGATGAVAAPGPTQEPIQAEQSTKDQADPIEAFKTELSNSDDLHTDTGRTSSRVLWSFNGTTWSPSGAPPDCAEPFALQTPVDMNIVTSALWPGQVRGGYKGHGGFRFDASTADDITVRAPIGSHLVQAARYLEGDDEQYLLFFSVPCGFFYRFDHVRTLPTRLEDALKDIPPATSGDSRTTYINPPVWIEQGDVVGTSVGIAPSNIFVDFGLYDVRIPNNVIPNPAWADLFAEDIEFGHFGVCFFDYLPGNDGEIMRSLPTGKEGKTSDYCD